MGTYQNTLSVLPFYRSLDEQLHRRPYSNGYIYPLFVSQDYLIPFFISFRSANPVNIKEIKVYKLCTQGDVKYPSYLPDGGDYNIDFNFDFYFDSSIRPSISDLLVETSTRELDGRTWCTIHYNGDPDKRWNLQRGIYYLAIVLDDDTTFYSEVFTAVPDSELFRFITISWSGDSDLIYDGGFIPYDSEYINRVHLSTEIGKPDYSFEEEGKDRDGYFFPEKQISKKTFKFVAFGPESLCDSMRLIGMSDNITVQDSFGRIYSPTSFNMEVEWLEDGYLAEISCEFNTDTVIKTVGKPINI